VKTKELKTRANITLLQYCRPVPKTKMEYIVCTTGRERHVREEWKKEREKVDQERIDRQKNEHGDWKREWDHEKINQEYV